MASSFRVTRREHPQNYSTPATSHANIIREIRHLDCPDETILDSTLSSALKFRNLVTLHVDKEGFIFHLTDNNVENIAATLPRLGVLQLGQPCRFNFRNATVASLLSISAHFLDLSFLRIHFNTLTIVGDVQRLLDGGSWCGKVKCKLQILMVGYLPVEAGEEDIETVMKGFRIISPCTLGFSDFSGRWNKLVLRSVRYGIG